MEYLNSGQMQKVDDLAIEKYCLSVPQMMENAGRNVARFIADNFNPKQIVVLYGKGNNGGDGLCCARHLAIYGFNVKIVKALEDEGNKNVEHQLRILKEMDIVPETDFGDLEEGDLIIDGLLGYNIKGNPRKRFAELIEKANKFKEKGVKIICYDLPSGMNPNTGEKNSPCVEADYTLTLALPKEGLRNADVGELYLSNIGIPNELYEKELGIKIDNYFRKNDVIKIE